MTTAPNPQLLTPAEVAQMFRVDPKTVARWAKEGRLKYLWTPGGHRRFYAAQVKGLLTDPVMRQRADPRPDLDEEL